MHEERTGAGVKVCHVEPGFEQFYRGYEARSLDTVLVQVIGMSAVNSWLIRKGGRQDGAYFDVITQTTP
jgi:hypothetical protein